MGAVNMIVNDVKVNRKPFPPINTRNRVRQPGADKLRVPFKATTVGRLLNSIRPGNSPALLLGECADGLPFLIKLGDPFMGAALIGCERSTGKTHHLQVLAESAVKLNPPSALQIGIITFKPGEWQFWERKPENKKYLQGIFAWYDPWAEVLIKNLTELAETRYDGAKTGAQIVLILDDLGFVEELSYEAQVNLRWLLEYGAQAGIFVVASINSGQLDRFRFWVEPFRTRIVGRITDKIVAETLTLRKNSAVDALEPGMFRVWTCSKWRTYRLPLLGD
ncbi:MAG: hypothetical protein BWX85_01539 [Chloroflexi bacterium ADurb.Bin120]|jgi:hypothetical protein|uniref:FtsK domain-containing protein n=1 Tax=Candidatus Brevifilum fermentans TaxID=1986204 RepID=A0A1Y6K5P1_9CHLR|nr:hypothetical protein [Brevefilum fermentans]OQB82758.1 MAG: hypothetical protein BWX85_01539 [Chloroflexi bacterium ADurb.Bin120]SMX55005.1 conserved protein of unknown function [Brevefilum fermentans]HOM66570.1 hypothetical protein [Brevefilum fermentans]